MAGNISVLRIGNAKPHLSVSSSPPGALANGKVSCWGRNDSGQLGNGEAAAGVYPTPGKGLGWTGKAKPRQPRTRRFGVGELLPRVAARACQRRPATAG